jgi:hypothetical protein
MTFLNSSNQTVKRTLALKKADLSNITVAPCCKAYINKLSVPGDVWTYTFSELGTPSAVAYIGGQTTLASGFKSYRSNPAGTTQAVSYKLQYYYNSTWNDTPPSWLYTSGSTSGGTGGTTHTVTVKRQEDANDSHHTNLVQNSFSNYDLSTYNVATGGTVSRTTANCYVVRGYGSFKFPLVYGNGVQGNSPTSSAYQGRDGTSGSLRSSDSDPYLGYFKDHNDAAISSPYITTQLGKSATDFSASIIWQDVENLITNVGISGSGTDTYVTFNVPKETIRQGNALIAVKLSGTIVWSWHIWVTDENLTACKQGPPTNGVSYYIAPVNIGWCDGRNDESYPARSCQVRAVQTTSGKVTEVKTISQTAGSVTVTSHYGNSPFYQWGRKDPLQASDGRSSNMGSNDGWNGTDKTYYYSSGYSHSHVDGKKSIGTAIQNPTTHYGPGSGATWQNDNWCSTDWINLWSSTINGYGTASNAMSQNGNGKTKTIYDPSPVGFRVPSIDVYDGFGTGNFTVYTNETTIPYWRGRRYTSNTALAYPFSGQRASSDSGLGQIGYYGLYWSSIPYHSSGYCAYAFYFNTGSSVYTQNADYATYRFACGFPIRPVKE